MTILVRAAVQGLLGHLDHEIEFPQDWPFLIIHGPNGVGKTRFLQLIAATLGRKYTTLSTLPFNSFECDFTDGARLTVERTKEGTLSDSGSHIPETGQFRLSLSTPTSTRRINWEFSYHTDIDDRALNMLERSSPVERLSRDEWFDMQFGDVVGLDECLERYGDHLPPHVNAHPKRPPPKAYREYLDPVSIHFIETQRLRSLMPRQPRYSPRTASPATVSRFAKDLARRIESTLAEHSRISSQLDRSFPRRLFEADVPESVTDDDIRARYQQQGELRTSLAAADVLDTTHDDIPLPNRSLEDLERRALWTYLEDSERKLGAFTAFSERLQLFLSIINSRFLFKEMHIDREHGFYFRGEVGQDIPLTRLSSGEQHELVLTYDLLFGAKSGSLVLIDEPEISLHAAWQKRFLSDLQRIAELTDLRFIIATHSPMIIDKWVDYAKALWSGNE